MNEESRPKAAPQTPAKKSTPTVHLPMDTAVQLRARRYATFRLEPLVDDCVLDPFDRLAAPRGPSSFGLDARELRAEIHRCQLAGWDPWELLQRFVNPATLEDAA